MPRVSDEHLAARRRQILDAARRCFVTKGLHNTSMQDLIREADLSVGAVYRYFKSKTDIVAAIADEVIGMLDARLASAPTGSPPSLYEAMEHVLRTIDKELGPEGAFRVGLQVWAEAVIDPAIADIVAPRYLELRARLRGFAAHARDVGELPADTDLDATAATLLSLVTGYALQRTLVGSPGLDEYLVGVRSLLTRS